MAIKVDPDNRGVNVATDVVDETHYPVYKLAVGGEKSAAIVDLNNPLPVELSAVNSSMGDDIKQMVVELKLLNRYMESITGNDYREDFEG